MELGLKGKSVLIVGASKGIGKAIAEGFAAEGCRIVAVARSASLLDEVSADCLKNGAASFACETEDIMQADTKEYAKHLLDKYGLFDVVVHNVGGSLISRDHLAGGEEWTYFTAQGWYKPDPTVNAHIYDLFNDVERRNINTLVLYQQEMGWRGGGTSSGAQTPPETETPPETQNPPEPETPPETETPPESTGSGYIFDTDQVLLTEADLEGRDAGELELMLNEIYARHGYIFGDKALSDYFRSQDWYVPVSNDAGFVRSLFNDTETQNLKIITDYMSEKGWR